MSWRIAFLLPLMFTIQACGSAEEEGEPSPDAVRPGEQLPQSELPIEPPDRQDTQGAR
jgi:hypothetical protein